MEALSLRKKVGRKVVRKVGNFLVYYYEKVVNFMQILLDFVVIQFGGLNGNFLVIKLIFMAISEFLMDFNSSSNFKKRFTNNLKNAQMIYVRNLTWICLKKSDKISNLFKKWWKGG